MQTNLSGVYILLKPALFHQKSQSWKNADLWPQFHITHKQSWQLLAEVTLPQELCHALHIVVHTHPDTGIASHQGCETSDSTVVSICSFCPWCYSRMVHFSLCTPTQLDLTCNGTNNYGKYKKKKVYHGLFDFWKKLTQIKSYFNGVKPTLFHH